MKRRGPYLLFVTSVLGLAVLGGAFLVADDLESFLSAVAVEVGVATFLFGGFLFLDREIRRTLDRRLEESEERMAEVEKVQREILEFVKREVEEEVVRHVSEDVVRSVRDGESSSSVVEREDSASSSSRLVAEASNHLEQSEIRPEEVVDLTDDAESSLYVSASVDEVHGPGFDPALTDGAGAQTPLKETKTHNDPRSRRAKAMDTSVRWRPGNEPGHLRNVLHTGGPLLFRTSFGFSIALEARLFGTASANVTVAVFGDHLNSLMTDSPSLSSAHVVAGFGDALQASTVEASQAYLETVAGLERALESAALIDGHSVFAVLNDEWALASEGAHHLVKHRFVPKTALNPARPTDSNRDCWADLLEHRALTEHHIRRYLEQTTDTQRGLLEILRQKVLSSDGAHLLDVAELALALREARSDWPGWVRETGTSEDWDVFLRTGELISRTYSSLSCELPEFGMELSVSGSPGMLQISDLRAPHIKCSIVRSDHLEPLARTPWATQIAQLEGSAVEIVAGSPEFEAYLASVGSSATDFVSNLRRVLCEIAQSEIRSLSAGYSHLLEEAPRQVEEGPQEARPSNSLLSRLWR